MNQRIGLIAIPIAVLGLVALVSWRAAEDSPQPPSLPSSEPPSGAAAPVLPRSAPSTIKPQERAGATAWGGLSWGASAKDVMALYPSATGDGRFIANVDVGGAPVVVVLTYEKDRLVDLTLGPDGGCRRFDQFYLLLRARYGEPESGLLRRYWRTKASDVTLMCAEGRLHVIYEDRVAARRRTAAGMAKLKEDSRGL